MVSGSQNRFTGKLERLKQNFDQVWTVVIVMVSFPEVLLIAGFHSSNHHNMTLLQHLLEAGVSYWFNIIELKVANFVCVIEETDLHLIIN